MAYWAYENWTHKKAIVHSADCSYCQHGRGVHAESGPRHGRWHGPFPDRDAAFGKAKSTERPEARACKACDAGVQLRVWVCR